MILSIDIEPSKLITSSTHSELFDFILQLDKEVADCDFTISLVKKLLISLENDGDMSREEIAKDIGYKV